MIGRIYAIALNTFREARRQAILYGIVLLVLGVNFLSLVLGAMSLGHEERVVRDVGLAAASFFGCVIAIVLSILFLHRELDRRTIHTIISKPIQRFEFVLGKYLGIGFTLSVFIVLSAVVMAFVLGSQGVSFTLSTTKALLLAYLEILTVAAIAIFFSSFSSWFLSGMFTVALFLVGRVTPEMREALGDSSLGLTKDILSAALYVVPDLHLFSISGGEVRGQHVSVHAEFVDWSYIATSAGYAAMWIGLLLSLAIVIFSRRDFV
jgi:ABC-type transport system involved in multi-copper enzyme maturation permease subunit